MGVSFWYRTTRHVSTALIPLAAADRGAPADHASHRPRADFLAQLIATLQQVPQVRTRRRAEPDEAIAAYDATSQWPAPASRALTRWL